METTRYVVRFETDGADLFVELHANDALNRQHLLERVVAILEDRHGLSCLLYTSPSPRDKRQSRMPSSA